MKYKVLLFSLILFLGAVTGVISEESIAQLAQNAPTSILATLTTGMRNTAGVFFVDSITTDALKSSYQSADAITLTSDGQATSHKIKILIVPGHEPSFGGTEYRTLKERDIVVDISDTLASLLRTNPRYQVMVSRDKQTWNPVLDAYFTKNWENILAWKDTYKAEMIRLVGAGKVKLKTDNVDHNNAPSDVARRLYGITKWVDENKYDIVIHLHINDNPRRNANKPGEYSGFAIYVPERQYSNAKVTGEVADAVAKRLSKYFAKSNMPDESEGVVEDQELVAIGRHNTVDAASMLIEYGYVYEPHFQNADVLNLIEKEYALATYLGVQDFFGETRTNIPGGDSFLLSHTWTDGGVSDILAAQFALANKGYYPPSGKSKNDCSMTGVLGACTLQAVQDFQKDHGILDEKGKIGLKTQKAIFAIESVQ